MKNLVKSFNQFVNEAMHPSDWYEDELSDCCGAPIMLGDICSDCKDHCEPQSLEDYENEETFDREDEDDLTNMPSYKTKWREPSDDDKDMR